VWRDESYHLLDEGDQHVLVILTETVSRGEPYPTAKAAERAFWKAIVESILTDARLICSATVRGVEVALATDPTSGTVHLATRAAARSSAATCSNLEEALATWHRRLFHLVTHRHHEWLAWRSRNADGSAAAWYTTRTRRLTQAESDAGASQTLVADSPADLAKLLDQEAGNAGHSHAPRRS
jgi:hypothetical protein